MKYEDIINKIEKEVETTIDKYIETNGINNFYGCSMSKYELEEALYMTYDRERFYVEFASVGDYSIMCIDNLLLSIKLNKTTYTVVNAITNVDTRRAEKILCYLQNNKLPIVKEEEMLEEA